MTIDHKARCIEWYGPEDGTRIYEHWQGVLKKISDSPTSLDHVLPYESLVKKLTKRVEELETECADLAKSALDMWQKKHDALQQNAKLREALERAEQDFVGMGMVRVIEPAMQAARRISEALATQQEPKKTLHQELVEKCTEVGVPPKILRSDAEVLAATENQHAASVGPNELKALEGKK